MNHLLCFTIVQEPAKNINVSQSFMSRSVLWSEWKLFNLFATLEFFSENFLGHLNFWKDGVFTLNFSPSATRLGQWPMIMCGLGQQVTREKVITSCPNCNQTNHTKDIQQQVRVKILCSPLIWRIKNPPRSFYNCCVPENVLRWWERFLFSCY